MILTLQAAGCTDEAAARQVGIPVCHLRRKVAVLMHRLQATSRFEAGGSRPPWLNLNGSNGTLMTRTVT